LEISDHPVLKTADGTQLTYYWINNEYKCTEVKDRNGNYISANYDNLGRILTVTDTLGRVITFNYDQATGLLHTITQTWTVNSQPVVHTWGKL
jgi:YD repeat-containing protein